MKTRLRFQFLENVLIVQSKKIRIGWCLYDWANSAFATVVLAAVLPVYFVSLVPKGGGTIPGLANHHFSAASLWGYSVAFSMFVLAIAAPVLGALADNKGWHKQLMIAFWMVGCSATALLATTGSGEYLPAALFFIVGNLAFAGANIFYNAYLPMLVPADKTDRLSAQGFATGYIGGGILLALVFFLILKFESFGFVDRGDATRYGFLLTAGWWFLFAIPTFAFLPRTKPTIDHSYTFTIGGYLRQFKNLPNYRDLCVFLIAFLFYNDGIQTIISVSAVYARDELSLSHGSIIGCFLMIQFLAMPGALLFAKLGEKIGTIRAILISLVTFLGVCFFAYRMTSAYEFWILGGVIAVILGGSQALSRSLFASMVPKHKTAEFFGFFSISSRFAAIFGPLLFAIIASLTGSSRHSILALGIFFIIGAGLLLCVNVKRGISLAAAE